MSGIFSTSVLETACMYHLSKNGPAPCTATVKECPLGGEHFETHQEAEKAFAQQFELFVQQSRKPLTKKTSLLGTKVSLKLKDPEVSKRIVLSDVDGTLVRGSLANDHAVWMHEKGIVDLGDLPARWLADPKNEELIRDLAQANLKAIAGKSISELRVKEFMDEVVRTDGKFYSSLEKLIEAREQGHDVILISGSPQYLINDFAKRFGFQGIGSEYHRNGKRRFNGRITGMFGADSKRQIVQQLNVERYDLVEAYGDTASDKPLLEVADHSVLVDPTEETLLSYERVDEILKN